MKQSHIALIDKALKKIVNSKDIEASKFLAYQLHRFINKDITVQELADLIN